MEVEKLKTILLGIKEKKITIDNIDLDELLQSMMHYIGHPDPILRDHLIYDTFCKIILNGEVEAFIMRDILEKCLSEEFLFYHIGDNNSHTVFQRSFTSLLLALIIYHDNEKPFLTAEEIMNVKQLLISYYENEKDLRGYVIGEGWAHSIAHGADVFDELVKNRFITVNDFEEMLTVLLNKALSYDAMYQASEDERIITPIVEMLNRGFTINILVSYLKNIPAYLQKMKKEISEEKYFLLLANTKAFLKSFYFTLRNHTDKEILQNELIWCYENIKG